MKILTYNVNGIRAAIRKDIHKWIEGKEIDIICFQETKAQPEQVDLELFERLGYHYHYWHSAKKKGYSGVLTLSKIPADRVKIDKKNNPFNEEGRILRTDYNDLTIINSYFPSGTTGGERQKVKFEFLDYFFKWLNKLTKDRKEVVIVGDFNIAHTEKDIHNPKSNKNTSGFLPEEREWMTKLFDHGYHDAFRLMHPNKIDDYSWWTYRTAARSRNKGWRIDYIVVSESLKKHVRKASQLHEAVHSDHCPVCMDINWRMNSPA